MSNKKVYAVRSGRKTGIFSSWDECKEQVSGYKGAEYKSFKTIEEAKDYINGTNNKNFEIDDNTVEAYVDGSYEHSIKLYGSGVVILKGGEVIKTLSVKGNDKDLVDMRNVAGEIEASKLAMNYCLENEIKNLILYFDYEGIEKWCTGAWKTNKEGTINYKRYYDRIKDSLNVKFVKVKAHSGNKFNDEADRLAKQSIDL
ncbi:ribonuclease H family protein [Clostridioides mangenotii]|uniref:ribonuclease H1 domain-containing protein n=1 Tax=Metaclostridioides mangenotii TaxID=1540 RepID=UPI001C11DD4E|nr:ribonuclease H family protein [Clostridioides mangenotii]MBU5306435.1 ribonuclease H family protein [Clostridioides mangenotii]